MKRKVIAIIGSSMYSTSTIVEAMKSEGVVLIVAGPDLTSEHKVQDLKTAPSSIERGITLNYKKLDMTYVDETIAHLKNQKDMSRNKFLDKPRFNNKRR